MQPDYTFHVEGRACALVGCREHLACVQGHIMRPAPLKLSFDFLVGSRLRPDHSGRACNYLTTGVFAGRGATRTPSSTGTWTLTPYFADKSAASMHNCHWQARGEIPNSAADVRLPLTVAFFPLPAMRVVMYPPSLLSRGFNTHSQEWARCRRFATGSADIVVARTAKTSALKDTVFSQLILIGFLGDTEFTMARL